MKKSFSKKLSLNKKDIAVLTDSEMANVQGGNSIYPCSMQFSCNGICVGIPSKPHCQTHTFYQC